MTVTPLDKVVDKIAALGVPGLVLVVAMAATGWAGAAAITTALAALGGPLGMLGGIAVLIILALISKALADYGFEAVFKATVRKLVAQGHSISDIKRKISSYPISESLKIKIIYYLDQLAAGNPTPPPSQPSVP
jgi:hypothetical protein